MSHAHPQNAIRREATALTRQRLDSMGALPGALQLSASNKSLSSLCGSNDLPIDWRPQSSGKMSFASSHSKSWLSHNANSCSTLSDTPSSMSSTTSGWNIGGATSWRQPHIALGFSLDVRRAKPPPLISEQSGLRSNLNLTRWGQSRAACRF